jgi:hypothetical protein
MTGNQKSPHDDDTARPPKSGTAGRRAYARPTLIEYGSVSKLTRGTMTKQADSPGAGFRMSCL